MPASIAAPVILGPDGITHTPHKFGLFSAVKPTAAFSGRWGMGVTIDDLCGQTVGNAAVVCAPGGQVIDWGALAVDSGIGEDIEAREIIYALRCKMLDRDATVTKATNAFGRLEQVGYEKILGDVAYTDGTVSGGADVTSVEAALAELLNDWYTVNPGQAIVHVTPNVATLLKSHVVNRTDHAELRTGEKLVIGAGYTNRNAMFASADLVAYETPNWVQDIPNTTNNDLTVLVRKTALVGSLCPMIYADLASTGLTP